MFNDIQKMHRKSQRNNNKPYHITSLGNMLADRRKLATTINIKIKNCIMMRYTAHQNNIKVELYKKLSSSIGYYYQRIDTTGVIS